MSFFGKNKLKIKSTKAENEVKFSIEYFNLKEPDIFKKKLLKNIIDSGLCLVIISTKFMYREQNRNYGNDLGDLIEKFDELNISYRKTAVKRKQNVSIFGISIKQNSDKEYEDYVTGFVVNKDEIENIIDRLNNYNLQYYIDKSKCGIEELLDRFEGNIDDEESLKSKFNYSIFEDNFIKQLVVYTGNEDSEFISGILENLSKDI